MGSTPEKRDPRLDVSGALHDVSNALTVLLGWVHEARSSTVPAAQREHALVVIERQARIARSIARRAIGAEALTTEGPAEDAIIEATDSVSALAVKRRIVFRTSGSVRGTTLDRIADFSQVLMNLCLNAIAFTPDDSTITISTATDARGIVIDVCDEGDGVPQSREEDIFSGESTRPGGAGVGLRHARALARAAGGELSLLRNPPPSKSESDAKGARFRIEWPRSDRVPKPPMSFSGLAVFANQTLLLVEDDDAVIELVETALSAKGAKIVVAKSLAACHAALAGGAFECAVVDLSPLGNEALAMFARLATLDVPVVLITGAVDSAPEFPGEVLVVRKPFELRELLDSLAKLLMT